MSLVPDKMPSLAGGARLARRQLRGHSMRLDESTQQTIKREAAALFGPDTRVRLFGSRADDSARGGDIDLLVAPATAPTNPVLAECQLAARLQVALGGRKVDVIVDDGRRPAPLVVRLAEAQGVWL